MVAQMKSMLIIKRVPMRVWCFAGVLALALALSAGSADAFSDYVAEFQTYAASLGGSTATQATGCQICHLSSGGGNNFNAYGSALVGSAAGDIAARLPDVGSQDSDGVGGSNSVEIAAGAQPGWCVATTPGCNNSGGTPPNVALDPAPTNQPPVANAGPDQAVSVAQTVQLNGQASTDPNQDTLTYSWSFVPPLPAGSTTTLSNPTTVLPTFVADVAGTYTVQLIVNDGTANSPGDTVVIMAAPAGNLPPTANAGPDQAIAVAETVTLNGADRPTPSRVR